MKLITTLLTILFISLLSSPSWSETMEDLVKRDGLYYKTDWEGVQVELSHPDSSSIEHHTLGLNCRHKIDRISEIIDRITNLNFEN